jgi:uncharacterized protein YqeY
MLKETLQQDLKAAMLARDTDKVEVLKGLKSAILYAEVEQGKREHGLNDQEILAVFKKEAKKRQDSVGLYRQGGNDTLADKELAEKAIIDSYLPEQLSEDATSKLIDESLQALSIDSPEQKDIGRIIGAVKAKNSDVDGAVLAALIKARLS